MGGAAEFPDRASSPLKRRASSMEPDTADQDATEDVDMIAAPTSDVVDTKSEQPYEAGAVSSGPTKDTQETAKTEEVAVQSTELTSGMYTIN